MDEVTVMTILKAYSPAYTILRMSCRPAHVKDPTEDENQSKACHAALADQQLFHQGNIGDHLFIYCWLRRWSPVNCSGTPQGFSQVQISHTS